MKMEYKIKIHIDDRGEYTAEVNCSHGRQYFYGVSLDSVMHLVAKYITDRGMNPSLKPFQLSSTDEA